MLWGHRTCITKLADVSRNGLTKIQKAYKLSRDKDYEYPAVQVLYDVNLLRQLKFAGDEEPDNWDQESVKRSWIIDLIRNEGRQVPVSLPQDDSRPPLTHQKWEIPLFVTYFSTYPSTKQNRGGWQCCCSESFRKT